MRHFTFLCIALTAAALSGCGDPTAASKASNNASRNARAEVALRLAHATEATGDYANAEKMYLQVVERSPGEGEPRLELAHFYSRRHEDDKALHCLQEALALRPDDTDIARTLANGYIETGDAAKAMELLDKTLATHPGNALLYNSRGVALDRLGKYRDAQRSYKTAYTLDPSGGAAYRVNLSMSYILSSDYDKAIALLKPMLDDAEAPAIVRQNLALAYGMKGQNANALKLGLEDLSTQEAEENVRFYRMLAQKHPAGATPNRPVTPVPPSVVRELFPENEPAESGAEKDVETKTP